MPYHIAMKIKLGMGEKLVNVNSGIEAQGSDREIEHSFKQFQFSIASGLGSAKVAFGFHYAARRYPCPAKSEDIGHQIILESPNVAPSERDALTVDAYVRNKSSRALAGLVVSAKFPDGREIQADARNNESGAPSLEEAPILPGAARGIRVRFGSAVPHWADGYASFR